LSTENDLEREHLTMSDEKKEYFDLPCLLTHNDL